MMTTTRPTTPRHQASHRPVSIPHSFLAETIAEIGSMAELQVSLAAFRLAGELGSEETPIAERTILRDLALRNALRRDGAISDPDVRILQGLELAVGRGTLLRFRATTGSRETYWYYLNTPVNRATVDAMQRGALPAPAIIWEGKAAPSVSIDPPNAFQLYEQNIGPLTPLIADQISRAVEDYPGDWIEDAIGEAVNYNRRSWRYVLRILENWQAMGRRDEDR
ncbi:MAG TPA: DnaD domain protein [Thermomicrobiales bacterium]|nr:DnaD domain protein [Thermomicrobiales bacterium]